ncbi:MAG: hypothetical protein J6R31_06945, partial [Rikenellaceae bacterium]|nr:hypothetical protein [Rikenellaceae bacterium]
MKRYFFLTLTLLVAFSAHSQDVLQLLTMEDAILNYALTPQRYITKWGTDAKGRTIYAEGTSNNNIKWAYPANGNAAEVKTSDKVSNKPRYYTKDNNLYYELDG